MRRLIVVGMLAALAAGGAYFCVNYQFEIRRGKDGLESITIRPRADRSISGGGAGRPADEAGQTPIRIATFNLDGLDEKKLGVPRVGTVLGEVIRRFDVVAVQGIRAGNLGVLVRLIERVNSAGGQYDYATYPSATPDAAGQYVAFLLNRASVEIDRSTIRSVLDQAGRLSHPPLVALFRAKGPDPTEAFTFKLVNVHIDAQRAADELELLEEVYEAVRDEEPGEDDVILLGELGAASNQDHLGKRLGLSSSISDTPTTLHGTGPVDNIVLDPRATTEFTGRAGVLDMMREHELTWREASEISDHLPVWAEFGPLEGLGSAHMSSRGEQRGR